MGRAGDFGRPLPHVAARVRKLVATTRTANAAQEPDFACPGAGRHTRRHRRHRHDTRHGPSRDASPHVSPSAPAFSGRPPSGRGPLRRTAPFFGLRGLVVFGARGEGPPAGRGAPGAVPVDIRGAGRGARVGRSRRAALTGWGRAPFGPTTCRGRGPSSPLHVVGDAVAASHCTGSAASSGGPRRTAAVRPVPVRSVPVCSARSARPVPAVRSGRSARPVLPARSTRSLRPAPSPREAPSDRSAPSRFT